MITPLLEKLIAYWFKVLYGKNLKVDKIRYVPEGRFAIEGFFVGYKTPQDKYIDNYFFSKTSKSNGVFYKDITCLEYTVLKIKKL